MLMNTQLPKSQAVVEYVLPLIHNSQHHPHAGKESAYPHLRILIFAIPRPCSGLESFYQQHWPGFEFLVDSSSGSAKYRAFPGWQNDDLYQVQVDSIEDIDESAEGVLLLVSEHSPGTGNSIIEMNREMYGIPDDSDWCSAFVLNTRRVNLSDIPLSVRGLSSGVVRLNQQSSPPAETPAPGALRASV